MSDRAVVVLALAAMAGAWWSRPTALALALALLAVASAVRRPAALWLAAAVLASCLGARSWSGVHNAPTRGLVAGQAVVVSDPEWVQGAVRLELRLDGRRVQAYARDEPAGLLAARLAGERVQVQGHLQPVTGRSRAYLARRHIGSRLTVTAVGPAGPGGAASRMANELRRTLSRGAESLGPQRKALFTGLVIGDDRDQSDAEVDDFRAAGLTHLLAVSGQNVAFAVAVVAPFLRRLGLRSRLVVGIGVLAFFGLLTRWEPSVLRATAMAGIALLASTAGRPVTSLRILALTVTGLMLIDPMLAGSVGFLLSAGACAGIAVVGPWLERRMPAGLAVTLAAQLGVAPILVPVFGGVPLASVPANLLAVPAAGPVMVWGLAAGVPAGVFGGRLAEVLHLPTRLLLWWITTVAHRAAAVPLPQVGRPHPLVVLGVAGVAATVVAARRRPGPLTTAVRNCVCLVTVIAVGAVAFGAAFRAPPDAAGAAVAEGARLWRRDGAVVLVLDGAYPPALLAGLRTARVRRVDVLVTRSGGSGAARAVQAVRHRASVRLTLAPEGHRVAHARAVATGQRVVAGPWSVDVIGGGSRLDVRVGSTGAPRARSPTL